MLKVSKIFQIVLFIYLCLREYIYIYVTVGFNTYRNDANKILFNILKQIYDITLKTNNTHCLKNSYQLIESLNKIKNVNSII